jgi:cytochrome c peroxidase
MVASLAGCGAWADDLFCQSEGCAWDPGVWERLSTLAHPPPPPPDPTNQWADNPAVAALGKNLYFETAFSGPSRLADSLRRPTTDGRAPAGQPINISCATCHDLRHGGVDVSSVPGNVSVGSGLTDVNALPTINSAHRRSVFWNGRLDTLWALNLVVCESDTTLNGSRLQTAHVLADRYGDDVQALFSSVLPPDWRERARALPATGKPGVAAYDNLSDADHALAITLLVLWAKAIAAYERQLVSADSDFDRFIADGPHSDHISNGAKRGARLFVGKAGCIDCHSGPLLTDEAFHDVGVPQAGLAVPTETDCTAGSTCDCTPGAGKNCLPWGAYNGLLWMRDNGPKWYPMIDAWNDDRAAVPHGAPATPFDESLKGAWRTPSLRDVALTAPYMHDGIYQTLEDVVWHYNDGGRGEVANAVGTPAPQLKPIGLTAGEAADLVQFLKSLTGAALDPALIGMASSSAVDASVGGPDSGAGGTDAGTREPDAGAGGSDSGAGAPAVPPMVQEIFDKYCLRCHPPNGGLALSNAQASYMSLVGVPVFGTGCTTERRVVPGVAAKSYLISKLRNRAPICGAPMPFGAPMLADGQIQIVEAWINSLTP